MHAVSALELALHSSPKAGRTYRVAVLPHGHALEVVSQPNLRWCGVRTIIGGQTVEGFVEAAAVVLQQSIAKSDATTRVCPIHLRTPEPVARTMRGGQLHALNEPGAPVRDADTPEARAKQLYEIARWLRVHRASRYALQAGATHAEVFVYDFATLAQAYVPRVWWTSGALHDLGRGERVEVIYGETVHALSARDLHRWFSEWGRDFGWQRVFEASVLQDAANRGQVCVITAQPTLVNGAGHASVVVPQFEQGQELPLRPREVAPPLQCHAGRQCVLFGGDAWWTAPKYHSHGFWVHA